VGVPKSGKTPSTVHTSAFSQSKQVRNDEIDIFHYANEIGSSVSTLLSPSWLTSEDQDNEDLVLDQLSLPNR
jgi:hypothetical protein